MSWLCCLLLLTPFQSKSAYKDFYGQGEALLQQKQYAQALDKYKEAFRLKPEAGRYREEGAFFVNYTPRYKIALCLEQTDPAAAEEWVVKSKDAGESNVLRKQKEAQANYHRDLERILETVTRQKQALAASYNLELGKANDLLSQHQFDQARAAFEELYRLDPSRPEAEVGLAKIGPTRDNFVKSLALDGKAAILEKKFGEADALIARIESVAPNHGELQSLKSALRNGRAAEKAALDAARIEAAKVKEDVAVAKREPTPAKTVESKPVPRPRTETRKGPDKKVLRNALLASLKPYRRGDPTAALARWNDINPNDGKNSASYYWLKALYLLAQHTYALQGDETVLAQARQALSKTLALQPGFEPSPDLYPDYVLTFFKNNTP